MNMAKVLFIQLGAIRRIRRTKDGWKRYMAILELDKWDHCLDRTGLQRPARRALLRAVRRWDDAMAVQLLGDMGDKRALPALEKVLQKHGIDEHLRELTELALKDIAPEKYGPRDKPRNKYTIQWVQPPPRS